MARKKEEKEIKIIEDIQEEVKTIKRKTKIEEVSEEIIKEEKEIKSKKCANKKENIEKETIKNNDENQDKNEDSIKDNNEEQNNGEETNIKVNKIIEKANKNFKWYNSILPAVIHHLSDSKYELHNHRYYF